MDWKRIVRTLIQCACGCGTMIYDKDKDGRPHKYEWGHSNYVNKLSGEKSWNWKGGRTMASQGYVLVLVPGHPRARKRGAPYVYEHVLVAEKKLGRYLWPFEDVHHKNEDKTDNRPENLEVTRHGKHQWDHHVMKYENGKYTKRK